MHLSVAKADGASTTCKLQGTASKSAGPAGPRRSWSAACTAHYQFNAMDDHQIATSLSSAI